MNRDEEHLQLLAIFHYVVAGLAAFFSFLPLLYTTVGVIFIFTARHGTAKPGEDSTPEFLGCIFALLGALLILSVIPIPFSILIFSRPLVLCKRYSIAITMACVVS